MIPVVIPYYKERKRLRRCRKQLKAQTVKDRIEVHIINDSRRSSGYTAAVNRGLRHFLAKPSGWDYIVILDQDMYLDPDAIEQLKKTLDAHPKCGVAVTIQRLYDRPFFVQAGGLDCLPAGTIETAHMTYFTEDRPIFWGDIACCMIRKECLWDTGVLDENFRFICSDSDYTLTARTKGWEVWICGHARGIHQKGFSASEEVKAEKDKKTERPDAIFEQMGRDQQLFRAKWEGSGYYKILKFEDDKPIRIIKQGEVIDIQKGGDVTRSPMRRKIV